MATVHTLDFRAEIVFAVRVKPVTPCPAQRGMKALRQAERERKEYRRRI
ncbi:hypothetical protein [Bacteroides eggerthii]|nr:hypothetical protein [Bacteroides eggerthii]